MTGRADMALDLRVDGQKHRLDVELGIAAALRATPCGHCLPGQIMPACALLEREPKPGGAQIEAGTGSNIRRRGTHDRIRAAIREASGQ